MALFKTLLSEPEIQPKMGRARPFVLHLRLLVKKGRYLLNIFLCSHSVVFSAELHRCGKFLP